MKIVLLILLSAGCIQAEVSINSTISLIENKIVPTEFDKSPRLWCNGTTAFDQFIPYAYQIKLDVLKKGYVIGCYFISGKFIVTNGGLYKTTMTVECWTIPQCRVIVDVVNGAVKNGLVGSTLAFLLLILHKVM